MLKRTLPGTDLALSVVGFGAWAIGGDYWGDDVSDARSIDAIHAALDHGINWFDTAPLYGHGHSEVVLARALQGRNAIIATKVGVMQVGVHAQSVLTPENLRRDLDASLKRLGTDCIDLLQVHWPCERDTPLDVSYGELGRLREEGKYRHLGVCNYNPDDLARIHEITPIVSVQTGYSLLRREYETGMSDAVQALNIGALAYEPLGRGLLTGKFTTPPLFPKTDLRQRDPRFQGARFFHAQRLTSDLSRIARKVGAPTSALAIGWVANRPGITSVIAGAKGPEQVAENAKAAALLSRSNLWKVVDKVAALHGGTPM